MLQEAAAWLNGQLLEHLSVPIGYLHGNSAVQTKAVVGATVFEADDGYGVVVRSESRDFMVSGESLSFEPAKGDRIVCLGRRYEVLAPAGEPVWRWSDAYRKTMRIHTRDLGAAEEGNGNGQSS